MHCYTGHLGAVGTGIPAMHCLTAWGQWAGQLVQCTATLPGRSGQCNLCNALPHCPVATGSGTSAMHCVTAWGHWAVELLQSFASMPGGSGQCNSCNALPQCLRAAGSETPAMQCLTTWGQWAVELLQSTASLPGCSWQLELLSCTASLPRRGGHWNSCNALPHGLGAVGSGTPAMHCHTAHRPQAVW